LGLTRNHEPTWLSRLPWLRIGIERRQTELRLEGSAIHTRDRSLTRLPGRWTEEVLGRCLCRPRLTRCGPLRLTRLLRNWSTTSRRRSHRTTRLTRLVHGSTRLPRSWPLGLTRLRLTRLRLTRLRLTRLWLARLLRTRLLRNRSATRWRRTLLTARRWLLLGQGHRGHGENACRGQRSQRR
jgi:hypothetical protein